MSVDTKAIRDALAEATQGPYRANRADHPTEWCIHAAGIPWQLAYLHDDPRANWPLEANAHLIAHAPAWLAAACDRIEALEAENSRLRDALTFAESTLDTAPGYAADTTFAAIWQWLAAKDSASEKCRAALEASHVG